MASSVQLCCACASSASYVCFCLLPLLPLCPLCEKKHATLLPGPHLLSGIESIRDQMDRDRWETIHRRIRNCKAAEGCVDCSMEAVHECMHALRQMVPESCLQAVIPLLDELKGVREQLDRDLCRGWDEVCDRLLEEDLSDCSDYARWMLSCLRTPCSLFTWNIAESSNDRMGLSYSLSLPEPVPLGFLDRAETALQGNHAAQPLPPVSQPTTIALTSTDILWLFECCTQVWTRTMLEPHGSALSGCFLLLNLADTQYVGAEGDSYSTAISHACVYRTYGYADRYMRLQAARLYPGTYIFHQTLYVFGGVLSQGDITASAEVLHIPAQSATLLPPMLTARRSFTPCGFQQDIYLCGGFSTTLCEKFNIPAQQYFALSLLLPEPCDTVACWTGEELVIVTRYYLLRWSSTTTSASKHLEWCGLAGSSVFLLSDTLYNAALGQVNAINLTTSKRTRYFPPPS